MIGLQAGNEPDFYARFRKRPTVSCLSDATQMLIQETELFCDGLLYRGWSTDRTNEK